MCAVCRHLQFGKSPLALGRSGALPHRSFLQPALAPLLLPCCCLLLPCPAAAFSLLGFIVFRSIKTPHNPLADASRLDPIRPDSLPPKSRNVRPPGCHHLRETCLHPIDNNPSTYSLHEPQTTSSDSVHLSCIHHSHGWNLVPCSLSPGSTEQSTSEHPQTTA